MTLRRMSGRDARDIAKPEGSEEVPSLKELSKAYIIYKTTCWTALSQPGKSGTGLIPAQRLVRVVAKFTARDEH